MHDIESHVIPPADTNLQHGHRMEQNRYEQFKWVHTRDEKGYCFKFSLILFTNEKSYSEYTE
jgi:hypothetical protein